MNAKISVFVICVNAIIYLILYNLHDCTFKLNDYVKSSSPSHVFYHQQKLMEQILDFILPLDFHLLFLFTAILALLEESVNSIGEHINLF